MRIPFKRNEVNLKANINNKQNKTDTTRMQ